MEGILLYSAISAIVIAVVLTCLSFVIKIVSQTMKWDRARDIAECVMWWSSVSLVLPFRGCLLRVIGKALYGWLLVFISPAAIITYAIIFASFSTNQPLPYEKLPFTSHDEIAAITEVVDFPTFEYEGNSHDKSSCETRVRYIFKDSVAVLKLYETLEKRCSSDDNLYWTKDTLTGAEEIEYWGGNIVYTCQRGWDKDFTKSPDGISVSAGQVTIFIGKKKFIVMPEVLAYGIYFEDYATPDSLEKITGVRFPEYQIVDYGFHDMFLDNDWQVVIDLKTKPSKELINAIRNAKNWTQREDGIYCFRKEDSMEKIYIDPQSRYVKIASSTY